MWKCFISILAVMKSEEADQTQFSSKKIHTPSGKNEMSTLGTHFICNDTLPCSIVFPILRRTYGNTNACRKRDASTFAEMQICDCVVLGRLNDRLFLEVVEAV